MPVPTLTDYIVAGCTVAIVIATVWQICYIRIQTANLSTQTDLLSRTISLAQSEQRAWVGATGVEANWEDSPPRITVLLTNRGNSPALMVRHEVRLLTKPTDQPFSLDDVANAKPIREGSTTVILPGESYRIGPEVTEQAEKEARNALRVADSAVYVFGWVEYQDVFHKRHQTTFARYRLIRPPVWAHTAIYNEMD